MIMKKKSISLGLKYTETIDGEETQFFTSKLGEGEQR